MGSRVAEVATLFLRLGFTAFGGPAAHVAMIEDEVVARRKWIDRQQFLDLLAAVNFIPGPNSTELAIHLGLIRAGFPGLLAAGTCFIVPAVLIILPLGYFYVTYGQLHLVAGPFVAIRAAIIAIIAAAMVRFARASLTDAVTFSLGLTVAALAAAFTFTRHPIPQLELILLAVCALAGAAFHARTPPQTMTPPPQLETKSSKTPFLALIATLPASSKLLAMSLFFLKIGATLFGSGYVLVSYLQGGLVDELHWMTSKELADAIAVGQVTPGPLLTTSTFIGYILGYRWGGHRLAVVAAVVATASIFAPSFFFVALLGRAWPRIRASRYARGALDGMNAAVTALIAITAIQLAQQSIQSVPAVLIAIATLMVLLKWKIDSTWLVLGAALVGLML